MLKKNKIKVCKSVPYKIVNAYPLYEDYISKYNGKTCISKEQVDTDLEEFLYLLETAYAGLDILKENNLNLNDFKTQILSQFSDNKTILISDFKKSILNEMSKYITDSHFSLEINNNTKYEWDNLAAHVDVYTSLIYLKKDGNTYKVLTDDIFKEKVINHIDSKFLFKTVYSNQEAFVIGCISELPLSSISVAVDDKTYDIPVYKNDQIQKSDRLEIINVTSEKGIYIKCSSFTPSSASYDEYAKDEALFSEFCESSKIIKNKEYVIFDLRHNNGGSSDYYEILLYSLFLKDTVNPVLDFYHKLYAVHDIKRFSSMAYSLESPAIIQADLNTYECYTKNQRKINKLKKKLEKSKKNPLLKYSYDLNKAASINKVKKQSDYKGKIIILQDKFTASSAELFIIESKRLFGKNVITVGENSYGAFLYGNASKYYLSNSGLIITIPYKNFTPLISQIESFKGEGKGIYPDFWAAPSDIKNVIEYITDDPQLIENIDKRKLKND